MLSLLFDAQREIKEVVHDERCKRSEIRRNADAEISRIQAETEAKKARIDEITNHNSNVISQFKSSIESCNSADELEKLWNEMTSQLKKY